MTTQSSPVITDMKVIPVAGHDSMLLNIGGAHNAYFTRNIVVLTQPAGFVKQPNSVMPMLRRVFRHYPEFVAALEHRHEVYNATLDDLARREAAGEIFVVRPSESVKVPSLCREPDELERIYKVGRHDAEATLPALEAYLAG